MSQFRESGITPQDLALAAEKQSGSLAMKLFDISRLYDFYMDELEKAGCDVTLLSIENADHADIHFFQKQIWDEICAFFKAKL